MARAAGLVGVLVGCLVAVTAASAQEPRGRIEERVTLDNDAVRHKGGGGRAPGA